MHVPNHFSTLERPRNSDCDLAPSSQSNPCLMCMFRKNKGKTSPPNYHYAPQPQMHVPNHFSTPERPRNSGSQQRDFDWLPRPFQIQPRLSEKVCSLFRCLYWGTRKGCNFFFRGCAEVTLQYNDI